MSDSPDYVELAIAAGQLVYTDDVFDDDMDSPTYDSYVRTYAATKPVAS